MEVSILVVASLSNRLAGSALRACPATIRVFAPSLRNLLDPHPSFSSLAAQFDVVCLNLGEWSACPDQEEIADRLKLLVVTDGPNGVRIRFLSDGGAHEELHAPVYPRSRPPVDTNRAGETLASTFLLALWEGGWKGGAVARSLIESAARRASAAAALQLDLPRFGFPDRNAIEGALRLGRVP
ncbi:MAG: PfkB family carbohydrate kinase [Isosphaeraceae bacterium]